MNAPRSLVVGTAGHVDHGKTSLIQALTGIDTDRLPEEKARGMTIDLGFASLTLQGLEDQPLELSFIDVPGHQAFLRNMMAGAGGIGCVLLVVAADEGPKPQTVEHLEICGLLGIRHGVVVVTKQDAATQARLALVRAECASLVKGTFLEGAPTVAVSANTGFGLSELKEAIYQIAALVPRPANDHVLRLPLDRVFSMRGFGTVVTGTLHDGILRVDDVIEVQPSSQRARIRSLQVHHHAVDTADAPTRVAVNLAGMERSEARRGDTLLRPGTLSPVDTLDVLLLAIPDAPVIRHGERVGIHAFTYEAEATVLLYGEDQEAGSKGGRLARLRLSTPLVLLPGDNLVLRRRSPPKLLGGAQVVDAHPLSKLRKRTALAWLTRQQHLTRELQLLSRLQRRELDGVALPTLVQETGLREEVILQALAPMLEIGLLTADKPTSPARFIESAHLANAVEVTVAALTIAPKQSVPVASLQTRSGLPDWAAAIALEQLLATAPVLRQGADLISKSKPALDSAQSSLLAGVEALYRSAGLAPPVMQEAASALRISANELSPILTMLLRKGVLVRMGADSLLTHSEPLLELRKVLSARKGQILDIAEFKKLTGLTRKHAIPLLEYLDGVRVTVNSGGKRKIL